MKRFFPWWAKIIVKMVLSKMPLRYSFFAKIGLFRHGQMDNPRYALQIFQNHFQRTEFSKKKGGFVALELGPGDSFVSAIVANAYGASKCYMVDAGNFAVNDIKVYQRLMENLQSVEVDVRVAVDSASIEDLLERVGGIYLTNGLQSLRSIPDDSVDFIWSQAVLEHVRLGDFNEMMYELRRILRPNGVASHRVDLKDHLGGALNNLRFSTKVWESKWMAKSGFYTNRIRYSDMTDRFENAGFSVDVLQVDKWDRLPIPRESMSKEFLDHSEDELCISGFDVLLRKNDFEYTLSRSIA